MAVITTYSLADCDCGKIDMRNWATSDSASAHAECPTCHNLREILEKREWYTAHVPFSARKRFTPHFNRSLGCAVESPEHLKHLQELHGVSDFQVGRVHSDGSCDYTSRDIDTGAAEKRKKAAAILDECTNAGDDELDYNPDGSMTVTELAEDE